MRSGEFDMGCNSTAMIAEGADDVHASNPVVVRDLRPRQIHAATLLVQGMQGKEVARVVKVAEETISRWRQQPEFQALMRELLQESVDATKLGLVSLCAESILHLRGLVRSFNDDTSLKAITLILGKVGPVLGVIGTELQRPSVPDGSR